MIVALPAVRAFAKPSDCKVSATVATAAAEDVQCTNRLTSWEDPSLNVPMAVNCIDAAAGIDSLPGATAMLVRRPEPTVTPVDAVSPAKLADIVPDPACALLMRPIALTVATFMADEDHDVRFVRLRVLPSEYVPVACSCRIVCLVIATVAGEIAIDCKVAPVTVRGADALTEPSAAVIDALPGASVLTRPVVLAAATRGAEDIHAA